MVLGVWENPRRVQGLEIDEALRHQYSQERADKKKVTNESRLTEAIT
jgi:hypothetical protein